MRDPADVLAEHLPRGQRLAESMMTTTARVNRPGSVEAGEKGEDVIVDGALVYEGRCRVKASSRVVPIDRESADATVVLDQESIHFPVTAGPFEVGDVVTITGSAHQPHLVDNTYRVTGLHEMELQTAQRVPVEVWRSPYGD